MNTGLKNILSVFAKILKIILLAPFAFGFTAAGLMYLFNKMIIIARLVTEGVYPLPYIFKELFMAAFMLALGFVCIRGLFSKKLAKVPLSKAFMVTGAILAGAVGFTIMDEYIVEDFTYYSYPTYILDWPAQSVTETFDCDYSQDTVYLSGYFDFISNDFRQDVNVEIVRNEKLTDSYRVEIIYKGKKSEMNIHHLDYMMEDEGVYMDSISIWPVDYDYEMSADDAVHMYRYGHDLRYSEPLAIEKITIRTAYPEKIDISNIEG